MKDSRIRCVVMNMMISQSGDTVVRGTENRMCVGMGNVTMIEILA